MGTENWLMFKSTKEARRAWDFLAPYMGGIRGLGKDPELRPFVEKLL